MANQEDRDILRRNLLEQGAELWRQLVADAESDVKEGTLTANHQHRDQLNQEHLDLLRQGVETWNEWRQAHPDIMPDLYGAVLSWVDLSGAHLKDAYLGGANLELAGLSGADLSGAHLEGANLSGAFLSDADLSGAHLSGANLLGAHLEGAHLKDAYLGGADLRRATLTGVDLRRAILMDANLQGATLSGVDLTGAFLSDINLEGANLIKTTLIGVDLRGASLMYANLRDANLRGADLRDTHLTGATLTGADLGGANLIGAYIPKAYLRGADLRRATLTGVDLSRGDLSGANLSGAMLRRTNLFDADLRGADLSEADLGQATLVETKLAGATLTNCNIYGISAWKVELEGARQDNLIITPYNEPTITVDNLKIAQFIYLLLNNAEIREVIDTIGQKGVLILGRFTPERKVILDALREKLRNLNFLPIVFDFERPTTHDFTETILTLAGLSSFIIADITNPKSSPLELQATIPNYMTPFVPIIQEGEQPFSMFTDLQNKYRDWVLDTLLYDTPSNLINALERAVVEPALERQAELTFIKAQRLRTRHIKDYF